MGKSLNHLHDDEGNCLEVAPLFQLVCPAGDRQQEGSMQTLSEALRSIRVVRNLRQQQLVELWVGRMRLNHRLDHPAHQVLERRRRMFHQRALDQAIDLIYMPLVQRVEN